MITHGNEIKLFAGNSNRPLAEAIARKLNTSLGEVEVSKFSDGETAVHICETVRGRDLFIIQSTSAPVNDNLMELLIMIDAAKRASAGADRVLTMDLHAAQIQGFFNIPVDNLLGGPTLYNYYADRLDEDFIVVSPDVGSVNRSRKVAERLGCPMAIIDKRRPRANVMEVMNIIGNVAGKKCLLVDDMIDTAGTIVQGAEALVSAGAKEIKACCTHAVLSGPAVERLQNSPISELVMLDTILLPPEKQLDKIKILSVADIFAAAIENVYLDKPMSKIYD